MLNKYFGKRFKMDEFFAIMGNLLDDVKCPNFAIKMVCNDCDLNDLFFRRRWKPCNCAIIDDMFFSLNKYVSEYMTFESYVFEISQYIYKSEYMTCSGIIVNITADKINQIKSMMENGCEITFYNKNGEMLLNDNNVQNVDDIMHTLKNDGIIKIDKNGIYVCVTIKITFDKTLKQNTLYLFTDERLFILSGRTILSVTEWLHQLHKIFMFDDKNIVCVLNDGHKYYERPDFDEKCENYNVTISAFEMGAMYISENARKTVNQYCVTILDDEMNLHVISADSRMDLKSWMHTILCELDCSEMDIVSIIKNGNFVFKMVDFDAIMEKYDCMLSCTAFDNFEWTIYNDCKSYVTPM